MFEFQPSPPLPTNQKTKKKESESLTKGVDHIKLLVFVCQPACDLSHET